MYRAAQRSWGQCAPLFNPANGTQLLSAEVHRYADGYHMLASEPQDPGVSAAAATAAVAVAAGAGGDSSADRELAVSDASLVLEVLAEQARHVAEAHREHISQVLQVSTAMFEWTCKAMMYGWAALACGAGQERDGGRRGVQKRGSRPKSQWNGLAWQCRGVPHFPIARRAWPPSHPIPRLWGLWN